MQRTDGLVADIDKPFSDAAFHTGKKHALKTPIGKINNAVAVGRGMWQQISKYPPGHEIRLYPAECALKQAIRFFKFSRCPALGTLVFN